jgi:uncharacterized protein
LSIANEVRVAAGLRVDVSPVRPRRPLRMRIHGLLRWLHVYVSMVSFLVVLFFALTGITLNHPDWVFGSAESIEDSAGQLPAGWGGGGEIDWLVVAEHLRSEHGVRGSLADYRLDEFEGSLAFRGPGYSADAFFDPITGEYQLAIMRQGFVGVLNELHRGQDAPAAWKLVVDLSGALLALLSLTGLGLLLYLRKLRLSALVTMLVGSSLLVVLMSMVT